LRSLVILFAALAFSGSAFAADLPAKALAYKAAPPVAAYGWTGFYVGANAGYAWGHSDPASSFTCPAPGACPTMFLFNSVLLMPPVLESFLRMVLPVVDRLVTTIKVVSYSMASSSILSRSD
jgi:opacity protein-like surface antigen